MRRVSVPGLDLHLEKIISLHSSRDWATSHPTIQAIKSLQNVPCFERLRELHERHWERLWDLCDIQLPYNPREMKLLRFHIFHLLQTVSLNTIGLDVGAPARGLHGEAYRGHIFWDELFIFPFLTLRLPELARSLLMYRYRRLGAAREAAKAEGLEGAMFPWQSGSSGEEESQILHLNPASGRWIPDNTHKQRHINGSILFNIWNYFQATQDEEFLSFFGAELALEIARFWVSSLRFDPVKKRYGIYGVVGPDEFHTRYPDRQELGIDNNAYTNFMASWCIRKAVELFRSLDETRRDELLDILGLKEAELYHWEEKSKKIYLPFLYDGVIDQFEGFDNLKELDWDYYRRCYGDIQRIDRILEAEGDSSNAYKVNKQGDLLMLFYLFSPAELMEGLSWMGYPFEAAAIPENIEHHLALSTNGSTLSRIVHAWVLSRYDIDRSWHWFSEALAGDIQDIQGGTTQEGIHLGAMAGTVDLVQRCFSGLEVRDDVMWIEPRLPEQIHEMDLQVRFRGHSLEIRIWKDRLRVKVRPSLLPEGKIGHAGKIHRFRPGDLLTLSINKAETDPAASQRT
jgi:trehalose/maltose hydrolase-like predicted phosphorylase